MSTNREWMSKLSNGKEKLVAQMLRYNEEEENDS